MLDGITGDGNAYIDLSCALDQDDEIEVDFTMPATAINSKNIFGFRNSASANNIAVMIASTDNNMLVEDFNNSNYTDYRLVSTNALSASTKYTVIMNKTGRYLYQGGTLVDSNTTACADTITTTNSYLFNIAGSPAYSSKFNGTINRCVIKGKRYLAPCKNASGVVGMYDTINGVFYGNANETGGFTAGNTVATVSPDRPADIWCNNGVLKANYNEFDENDVTNGYFYNADLEWVENSAVYTSDYMEVEKGKYILVMSLPGTLTATVNVRVNLFDANKVIQSQLVIPIITDDPVLTQEVDIPSGISYVRISTNKTVLPISSFKNSKTVYTDGTVETIAIKSPNIFDNANTSLDVGQYLHVDTHDVRNGTNELSVIYQLVPGKTYTLTRLATGASIKMRVGFFDTATPAVGSVASDYMFDNNFDTTSLTFTVPAGKPYMFATLANSTNSGRTITEQQCLDAIRIIETVSTATCEDLLSVGTYTDQQEIIDGTVTRKVGVKVLDGTENWQSGATGRYYLSVDQQYLKNTYTPLCTHFPMSTTTGGTGDMTTPNTLALYVGGINAYQMYAYPSTTTANSLSAWKQWLADQYAAGTPVIVVYLLATSTTETVTGQPMETVEGDNVVEITQASIDDLEVGLTYMKES